MRQRIVIIVFKDSASILEVAMVALPFALKEALINLTNKRLLYQLNLSQLLLQVMDVN